MQHRDDLTQPQIHRLAAHLTFDEHGLDPYWAVVSQFEPDLDGLELTYAGEDYRIGTAAYWQGKIAARPSDSIDGGLYEYKIGVWSKDGIESKGADFTFRPGFSPATHVDSGDEIGGIPSDLPESIRVQVEASNLPRLDVLGLLQSLADAIDIDPDYFRADGLHEFSSIYGLETYLRLDRAAAIENVVGQDGILEDIAQFSSGQGQGEHKWDHEEITGHYETVALDPASWGRLIPEQDLAKRLKCYQPANPRSEGSDDPLSHHKIETQYWSGYYSDHSISWNEYHDAVAELRQTALSALSWAGLETGPRSDIWVADAYWEPEPTRETVAIPENPIPEEAAKSERRAQDALVDPDISEAEFNVIDALRKHGGAHVDTIASLADRSRSSVYRALEQFQGLITSHNGDVQWRDEVVKQQINEVVSRWRKSASSVVDSLQAIAERANPFKHDGRGNEPGPVARWLSTQPIELLEQHPSIRLQVTEPMASARLRKVLEAGVEAAERSGMLTTHFERARINWIDADGQEHDNWVVAPRRGTEEQVVLTKEFVEKPDPDGVFLHR